MSAVRTRDSAAARLAPGAAAGIGRRSTAARRGAPKLQVSEVQRSRLLAAAVRAIDEVGYADTSVADITARARISRRTFYDLFENRGDCLASVLEDMLARVRAELAVAGAELQPWRDRVRCGLYAILAFFDREPVLARACVVQVASGSKQLLERRTAIFAELASVIDDGRGERAGSADLPPLTAEGLVGAAHAIVYERLLRRSSEPLIELLPQLMGMIVLPYLGSSAARREQSRPVPEPMSSQISTASTGAAQEDYLRNIPMRLTYRTIRVLAALGANPGASNRIVGEAADVSDQGQISKLLGRLQRLGLVENGGGHNKGECNAWRLTSIGERVAQSGSIRQEHQWTA